MDKRPPSLSYIIQGIRKVPEHFDTYRIDRDINIIHPPYLLKNFIIMVFMRDETIYPHLEKLDKGGKFNF